MTEERLFIFVAYAVKRGDGGASIDYGIISYASADEARGYVLRRLEERCPYSVWHDHHVKVDALDDAAFLSWHVPGLNGVTVGELRASYEEKKNV